MRLFCGIVGALAMLTVSSLSRAEERATPAEPARAVPAARTGFQLALRTGVSVPLGKYVDAGSADMSDFVSPQVPVLVDIGGKIGPNVFLGGYLGLGVGGAAGRTADACDRTDASCASVSFRIGAEVLYFFMPERKANPWAGYGIGLESTGLGSSGRVQDSSTAFAGWEFAHFMGGVDFRLSRIFGVGPFIDFALGSYSQYSFKNDPGIDADGDVDDTALHEWITVGARFVFFP